MQDALGRINTRQTDQRDQARSDQVANNASGFVFAVDDWQRALRFLVLGTSGGTYYVTEKDLTKDNAEVILRLADTDGERLVKLIVGVSQAGRAPRQNPTLFALAACTASKDVATRRAACDALPLVCRTGTHLFIFARYVEQFRGWGRLLRRAVGEWYTAKPVEDVAFQAVKYRQREGWSHRDLLRLSHPETDDESRRDLFDWIAGRKDAEGRMPIVHGYELAQGETTAAGWAKLVTDYGLPWEALPSEAMNQAEVWEALLPKTGITALIRQLARLTNLGLISPLGGLTKIIVERLTDQDALRKGRVHPLQILSAEVTYARGHGFRGDSRWTPNNKIVEALNEAFYLSFGVIEPANKRTLLGLDVSGSMTMGTIANSPIAPFQAEAALAMVALRTEPEVYPMAFSRNFVSLPLTGTQRLDDVIKVMQGMPFGGTDCAVPMVWATQNKIPVDIFIITTDNETWAGSIHPFQALKAYRDTMGIPARLAVVGMVSSGFSIADPTDAGMLDVVGFDTATPDLINSFARGDI